MWDSAKDRLQGPPSRVWSRGLWALLWILGLGFWSSSPSSLKWASQFEWPLLFEIRGALGKEPKIDSKLKTFAFDDRCVALLKRSRLNFKEWAQILEALGQRRPAGIVIDAMFSVTESVYDEQDPDLLEFQRALRELKAPIYVGAFASPAKLPARSQVETGAAHYSMDKLIPKDSQGHLWSENLFFPDYRRFFLYGPSQDLQALFSGVGHILSGPVDGTFFPILKIDDRKILRHLALSPFPKIRMNAGELRINGTILPITKEGRAWVNYPSRSSLHQHVQSMEHMLDHDSLGQAASVVQEGDVVFLMPMYFTGNVDFKPSPIGLIPGGYTHIAVMNSVLRGDYIKPSEIGPMITIIMGALSISLGLVLSPLGLSLAWFLLVFSWLSSVALSFVIGSVLLPITAPVLAITGVCLALVVFKLRDEESRSRFLHQAFDGKLQAKALRVLEENPEKLTLDARERVLTIMFIDIVGFSLVVENQAPRLAFEHLKDIMDSLADTIHLHGGIVNKTLGDGLLCFFGYSFLDDREGLGHAEEALRAALAIQRENVQRMLRKHELGEPIFPLRIGINTSAVLLGNLGKGERIDLTVIGNGVNFTKRLEGACTPHSVLVGPTTKELVEPQGDLPKAQLRMIRIKHHQDDVEAWEYDPLAEEAALRRQADDAYARLTHLTRLDRRWFAPKGETLRVTSLSGSGNLLNFSTTGLSFDFSEPLARGDRFEFELRSSHGQLEPQLAQAGLRSLTVEIRWVQGEKSRFVYGGQFIELSPREIELLTDILCQYCTQDSSSSSQSLGA